MLFRSLEADVVVPDLSAVQIAGVTSPGDGEDGEAGRIVVIAG